MTKVIWRLEALADLDDIVSYIEQFDPRAAHRYEVSLRTLGESLAVFPSRGRPATSDTREMTTVPPYILRYQVADGEVYILSIRHGRQQPQG